MKNENGFGSIYKLKHKKHNQWTAVVTTGWKLTIKDGQPKAVQDRVRIGYYPTRKDAQLALFKWHESHSNMADTPTSAPQSTKVSKPSKYTPTIRELLNERYNVIFSNCSTRRLKSVNSYLKVLAPIEDTPIDKLDYRQLQKFADSLADAYAITSLSEIKVLLNMIYDEAIKLNYVQSCPVKYVNFKSNVKTKAKRAIPPETIRKIASCDDRVSNMCVIMIYSGMRIGELVNAKKENYNKVEHYLIGGEKTKAGKDRVIPIHPYIQERFETFLNSKKVVVSAYSKELKKTVQEKYGYTFTFHECRHTFVTLANQYDLDNYSLHKIVGHAASDVTEAVYTHIRAEKLYAEVCKIPTPDKLK